MSKTHLNLYFHNKIIPFETKLSLLHPVGKVDLQGLSLVTKYSHDLPEFILTCDESGYVYLINSMELELQKNNETIPPIRLLPKKQYKCDNGAIFDVEWHDNSKKFLTASGQSNSLLWDTETGEKVFQNPLHNYSIRTIESCTYNNSLFVSGGRDGRLILWDYRIGKSGSFQITDYEINDMKETTNDSFTGICFYSDEKTLITSQANNDNIKIWDLRKVSLDKPKHNSNKTKIKKHNSNSSFTINQFSYLENKIKKMQDEAESIKNNVETTDYYYFIFFQKKYSDILNNVDSINYMSKNLNILKGVSSIFLNKKQNQLMVNSIDHNIILYDLDQIDVQKPKEFKGHKTSYYVKSTMSPCSTYILSGSTDHNLYIWKNNTKEKDDYKKPILILKNAHNGEINGVDWGLNNSNFIASTGDDRSLLIWDFI